MKRNNKQDQKKGGELTPLMQQYHEVKGKYPGAIVLFRVGDFYETFGSDAVKVSEILNIVLTSRNNGGSDVELAGFPNHSLDIYLPKLVRAGYRVAICDQLEKPTKGKKLVERGVTSVVTPGLTLDESLLDNGSNNYLASLHYADADHWGVALLDISTGEFIIDEGNLQAIESLFQRFRPSELIYNKADRKAIESQFQDKYSTFKMDEWIYHESTAQEKLLQHFKVASLKGYGIQEMNLAQVAASAILYYLEINENKSIGHINKISRIPREEYMWLDRFTIRNLELIPEVTDSRSLLEVIDHCHTPMGSRMLKKWLLMPLLDIEAIKARQTIVHYLLEDRILSEKLNVLLKRIGDLERLLSKSAMGRIQPREVNTLCDAIETSALCRQELISTDKPELQMIGEAINPCISLSQQIRQIIKKDAPALVTKGNFICDGVNTELDEYRYLIANNKEIMARILEKESEASGIPNLKIGFNNVFGYYFEVTQKHKHTVMPDYWIRKQTLTNSERYITEEIKQLEDKILHAEQNIQEIEEQIFHKLTLTINEHIALLQANCLQIAALDCQGAFAHQAVQFNYCRPEFNTESRLEIKQGRHPIIEVLYGHEKNYIPNDLYMDADSPQIIIITGPNMAGKSAILRQTGLICLLSQIGSYVPAMAADIPIIDKLFTRVGASDNIMGGESTFMVEMNETASIINNLSDKSLILLDEIGRGTSTYDGLSIAWALVEYLHDNPTGRPKTLFATHYHELNELGNKLERVENFHVAVKELSDRIVFLYQLLPGGSEHSFGIHVAKMAGLPEDIIQRAQIILKQLENSSLKKEGNKKEKIREALSNLSVNSYQLSIFETSDPSIGAIRELLLALNTDTMTPVECLLKLKELQNLVVESLTKN